MRSLILLAGLVVAAIAEDGVRITFLPPPLDGTLSAGVYSLDGKLLRVLASEAHDDAFTIGLNGLITHWDGKDAVGTPLAAGKYFVRGFAVGDVVVEGVAFHGNDWIEDDDVPRLRDLLDLRLEGRELLLRVIAANGSHGRLRFHVDAGVRVFSGEDSAFAPLPQPAPEAPSWSIEEGTLVQRKGDEVLRQLAVAEPDPQPFAVAAAADRDEIFLLERNAREVRLRALRLKETKSEADGKTISEWEVFISKSIAVQGTFADAAPALGREEAPLPEERVRVALMRNELLQVAPASLQIGIAFDDKGSFLRTADGLLLRRVTSTPNLQWAVLVREPDGAVSVFQSDGAVTEEYRLRKLDQMMAFDAGEYEWTGAK